MNRGTAVQGASQFSAIRSYPSSAQSSEIHGAFTYILNWGPAADRGARDRLLKLISPRAELRHNAAASGVIRASLIP